MGVGMLQELKPELVTWASLLCLAALTGLEPVATAQAEPLLPVASSAACAGPDWIVRDDGTAENAAGWDSSQVSDGHYADRFNLNAAPPDHLIIKACIGFLQTGGDTTIDFGVDWWTFDGVGFPDTRIGSIPATATGVPSGLPGAFYEVDVSPLQIPATGEVAVGPRWDPMEDEGFFFPFDETPASPFTDPVGTTDGGGTWDHMSNAFPNLRVTMVRLQTGPPGEPPCIEPDRGDGTVNLPPERCSYQGPLQMIDGLPAGSTIQIGAILHDIVCVDPNCERPGGTLGGSIHEATGEMEFNLRGTGSLFGFNRRLDIPFGLRLDSAPRTPGDPVQAFPIDVFSMETSPYIDPDFLSFEFRGGTGLGFPSQGSTTFTNLSNGNFYVESFFDIAYEIEFEGAPGGALDGLAGTTADTQILELESIPIFDDGFESGDTGAWTDAVP